MMISSAKWLGLAALILVSLINPAAVRANQIAALINDDPITAYDVAQRQRFLALTAGGVGDKIRAKLNTDEVKNKWKEVVMREKPQSQEQAKQLQQKFVEGLQQQVLNEASSSVRKEALEQLIDEQLMLQEAKKLSLAVTDEELKQALTQMAEGRQEKLTLQQFLGQFSEKGVNPKTLENKIRAQIAWRNVVRRLFSHRVQPNIAVSSPETTASINDNSVFDLRVVRFSLPAGSDQKFIGQRFLDAEKLKNAFTNCDALAKQAKLVNGAALKALNKAKISSFPEEARALLAKAQPGQMTTPVLVKDAVEAYAVCQKRVETAGKADGKAAPKDEKSEKRQEDLLIYAKRHLKDLRQNAHIDYR